MFGLFTQRRKTAASHARSVAPTSDTREPGLAPDLWQRRLPELARVLPAAPWRVADATDASCACCGTPHAGMIFHAQPLCITCASVLSFDRPGLDARVELVWLPFTSQAALNRIMGAHLRACRSGPSGAQQNGSGTPGAEIGKEQFAHLLRDARRTAEARLGDVSPAELVAAWRDLASDACEAQTALRFLPTGVWQNESGRNVFTEILSRSSPMSDPA